MRPSRALWFVAPRRVEIRSEPLPAVGEGEILVRTLFSGISSGTELLAYRGELDPDMPVDATIGSLGGTFRYPFRYGYSCVGVVEASRSPLSEGSLVFAFHPHTDRFVVAGSAAVPLPRTSPRTATLLPFVETALQVVLDAGPRLGETVVVYGLGVVGALTALLLGRAGAAVIGVEPRSWRRDLMGRQGVDAVTPVALAERPAAEDGTVSLVVEASGNPEVAASALDVLAHEGTLLVAAWYGTKDVNLPLGGAFHRRRLTIRSSQVSTIPAALSDRWDRARRLRAVLELLAELPLGALATDVVPFEEAPRAYQALDEGKPGVMHVALGYGNG